MHNCFNCVNRTVRTMITMVGNGYSKGREPGYPFES